MSWEKQFVWDWELTTRELRKFNLNRVKLVPLKDDIRVKFDYLYGDDAIEEMTKIAAEMGMTLTHFHKRCRRAILFTPEEKALLAERLNLTEEEKAKYL